MVSIILPRLLLHLSQSIANLRTQPSIKIPLLNQFRTNLIPTSITSWGITEQGFMLLRIKPRYDLTTQPIEYESRPCDWEEPTNLILVLSTSDAAGKKKEVALSLCFKVCTKGQASNTLCNRVTIYYYYPLPFFSYSLVLVLFMVEIEISKRNFLFPEVITIYWLNQG